MGYLIAIVLMFLLGGLVCSAKIIQENKKFSLENTKGKSEIIQTDYTWETRDGKEYNIFITGNGKFYINKISKNTGKEYKYYLPKEAQEELKKQYLKEHKDKADLFNGI